MKNLFAIVSILALALVSIPSIAQLSLTTTDPQRNAVDVPTNKIIVLQFNANIDPVSAQNSFSVESNLRGRIPCSISVSGKSVTVTPAFPFLPSEEISISISLSLRSTAAAQLAAPTAFQFVTATKPSFTTPPSFVDREVLNLGEQTFNSIAAVDMDRDNDIDVCFFGQTLGWLENNGTGEFSRRDIAPVVGGFPANVVPFDIDQDGDMDLVTTAYYGIGIYLNDGAQNFNASPIINGFAMQEIDIVDFNGDGLFDIVHNGVELINDVYVGGTFIQYNQGAGTFSKTKINSFDGVKSKGADIDNDGDWDVIQHDGSRLSYLLNTGTTFISDTISIYSPNTYIDDFGLADLNNDRYIDIIVTQYGQLEIWLNHGTQHFTSKTLGSGIYRYSSAGDFDGDHDIDIITLDGNYIYVMWENDGEGNFVKKETTNPVGEFFYPSKGVNADFDGDGDLDFVSGPRNNRIVLFENFVFPFSKNTTQFNRLEHGDADWGDFDGDGDLDVITLGLGESSLATTLYENREGQLVVNTTSFPGMFLGSCDWGDFDKDGDLDILLMGATVVSSDDRKPMTCIYTNNNGIFNLLPSSKLQLPETYHGEARWADFDNDGWLDIVVNANGYSGIYRSDGKGNFASKYELPFIFTHGNVATGDYDNDGDVDLAMSGWGGNDDIGALLKVFRNDGDWKFHDVQGEFVGRIGGNLSWTDMDNDGDLDLVVSGQIRFYGGGGVASNTVYENQDATFKAIENSQFLYHTDWDGAAATGDFDNDGISDVIASTRGSSSFSPDLTLLKNDGNGDLKAVPLYLPNVDSQFANWVDYDVDHDLDIFVSGYLLTNNIQTKNTPPVPPTAVQVDSVYNNAIYFSWNEGDDNETSPAGLSYQLYVGTQSKSQNVINSNAQLATGLRKVAEDGNSKGRKAFVTNLSGGVHFFGVQSVDASFEGSTFSAEGQTLVVAIKGTPGACRGLNHSYVAKPSGNYTWQVAGGTIVSGQGSDSLVVNWTSTGKGYVKIFDVQGLKNRLDINVDEVPEPLINGDALVCAGLETYSVADARTYSAEWSGSGVNAVENKTSRDAQINWTEAGEYNLVVKAFPRFKGCFSYNALHVMVDQRPDPVISGDNHVCIEQDEDYSTMSANVVWKVVNGQPVDNGLPMINVKWTKLGSGAVILQEKSTRGFCTEYDTMTVTVSPRPDKPVLWLYQDSIILSTASPSGFYAWYYGDELIVDGPYQGLISSTQGTFVVEVFNAEGCGTKSDPFHYLITDIEDDGTNSNNEQFSVYPNPADQSIALQLSNGSIGESEVEIYSVNNSLAARFVYGDDEQSPSREIDISHLTPGTYVIRLRTKKATYRAKFIKK